MANRQETVCNYIYENYVQFERLRHDVISNKVQINDEMSAASPLNDEMMEEEEGTIYLNEVEEEWDLDKYKGIGWDA